MVDHYAAAELNEFRLLLQVPQAQMGNAKCKSSACSEFFKKAMDLPSPTLFKKFSAIRKLGVWLTIYTHAAMSHDTCSQHP